jgi:hypothetical protein
MATQTKGSIAGSMGERLIKSADLDKYTVNGQVNVIAGGVDLQCSLCQILANCRDFKEEETALQH